jgi:nucleotide-binding universal stress UspA family protein
MRFLVAIDGTTGSDSALDHAAELAAATGGDLVLVHAVDPSVYEATDGPVTEATAPEDHLVIESTEDAEERGLGLLEEAAASIPSVDVTTELLYGPPAEAVAEYAGEVGAAGVIVGHRRLSEEHERVLGSVAKKLLENSPVPVTVVRPGARD